MPAKLSDAEFIARARANNRTRAARQRERQTAENQTVVTVWIPADLKTALTAKTGETGETMNQLVSRLLMDSLTS